MDRFVKHFEDVLQQINTCVIEDKTKLVASLIEAIESNASLNRN